MSRTLLSTLRNARGEGTLERPVSASMRGCRNAQYSRPENVLPATCTFMELLVEQMPRVRLQTLLKTIAAGISPSASKLYVIGDRLWVQCRR